MVIIQSIPNLEIFKANLENQIHHQVLGMYLSGRAFA
jgi:hypothetical protein